MKEVIEKITKYFSIDRITKEMDALALEQEQKGNHPWRFFFKRDSSVEPHKPLTKAEDIPAEALRQKVVVLDHDLYFYYVYFPATEQTYYLDVDELKILRERLKEEVKK